MLTKELTIMNETGLHARPASALVTTATAFVSDIKLTQEEKIIDAKSIINLLSLGLRKDDKVTLVVDGIDETDAYNKIVNLFESGFGDD